MDLLKPLTSQKSSSQEPACAEDGTVSTGHSPEDVDAYFKANYPFLSVTAEYIEKGEIFASCDFRSENRRVRFSLRGITPTGMADAVHRWAAHHVSNIGTDDTTSYRRQALLDWAGDSTEKRQWLGLDVT